MINGDTMKKLCLMLGLSSCLLLSCVRSRHNETNLSRLGEELCLADPTIIRENGMYYMTGTGRDASQGFVLFESKNLKDWHEMKNDSSLYILKKGNHVFGDSCFWAPQWFKDKKCFYLAYTANEQVALAMADSWMGPFQQMKANPVDISEKNIDPFLFRDDDGKYYLYHVRFNRGNYIWVGEFDLQKGEIKSGTLKQCLDCTEPWENTANYISNPIMEGPSVIKLKDTYYLFYSANHFMNIDYAVGYAIASSPLGPWKKFHGNPIIHRNILGENGSGHGDVFIGDKDCLYYVYHIHNSDSTIFPRKTRIVPLCLKENKKGSYDISIDKTKVIKPFKTE